MTREFQDELIVEGPRRSLSLPWLLTSCLLFGACVASSDIPATAEGSTTQVQHAGSSTVPRSLPESGPWVGPEELEPITGYGDFSSVEYWQIDWYRVVNLEIQCLNDQGFAVEVIPPGDGISFSGVSSEQLEAANRAFWACQAGLNLPEYTEPTHDELEEHYYYLLELSECVEAEGYATTDAPSLDVFIESGGAWSPYDLVANDLQMGITEWYALNVACPQSPRNR